MKAWNFKLKSNPNEISQNLESALKSVDGLVFNMTRDKKNSITFQMRKRIQYAWYLIYINSINVNGKLSKTDTENETKVEILFSQHFLWKLVIYTHVFMGLGFLIAIFSGSSSSSSMYILGGILIGLGIVLWIAVQKKFEKDTQKYKALISEILEF